MLLCPRCLTSSAPAPFLLVHGKSCLPTSEPSVALERSKGLSFVTTGEEGFLLLAFGLP